MRLLGHWLYCRKCLQPEVQDGIVLCDESREQCNWLEIIDIGEKVGTDSGKDRRKQLKGRRDYVRCLPQQFVKGQLVLCPDTHDWGVKRSPFDDAEFFVDECVPQAVHDNA